MRQQGFSACIRHHHCLSQPEKGGRREESQNRILNDQTLTGLGLGKGGGHLLCWVLAL